MSLAALDVELDAYVLDGGERRDDAQAQESREHRGQEVARGLLGPCRLGGAATSRSTRPIPERLCHTASGVLPLRAALTFQGPHTGPLGVTLMPCTSERSGVRVTAPVAA